MESKESLSPGDVGKRLATLWQLFLAAVPVLCALYSVWYLVSMADRGFDITDEGYYLLHAQNPTLSTVADLRSFGYYTGILYRLAGGDVALFRILGVCCLLLAAVVFAKSAVRVINRQLGIADPLSVRVAKVSFIVVGVLLHYSSTIRTPNYNTLILFAMLVATGAFLNGLVVCEQALVDTRRAHAWFGLTGAALALSVFAKPTSALLLSGLLLGVGVVWPRLRWRDRGLAMAAVVAGGCSVALVHALFFQSPLTYLEAVQRSMYGLAVFDPSYGPDMTGRALGQLVTLRASIVDRFGWWYVVLPTAMLLVGGLTASERLRNRLLAGMLHIGLVAGLLLSFQRSEHLGGVGYYGLHSTIFLSWAGLILVTGACAGLTVVERFASQGRSKLLALLLSLLIWLSMPVVYALGSNNPVIGAASTGIGPVFAAILVGLSLMAKASASRWLSGVGAAGLAVVAASAVVTAGASPFRLNGDLEAQRVSTEIGVPTARLGMDEATHSFFGDMRQIAGECGYAVGSDIIDLTGQSPGLVYALGGVSPGTAWYGGGYPGSDQAAEFFLSFVPEERRRSIWLLATPDYGYGIEPTPALQSIGLDFPGEFDHCGTATWPRLGRNFQLWRPARPAGDATDGGARLAQLSTRAQNRGDAASYETLGTAYYEVELYDSAIAAFEQALALDPELVIAPDALCVSHMAREEWEKAVDRCRQATAVSSQPAVAAANLLRAELGRNGQAGIDALRDELRSAPSDSGYVRLSLAYYGAERFEDSIDASRGALELNPRSAVALNNMCASYNALEQWARAEAACAQALLLAPDFELARNNLNWARSNLASP